MEGISDVLEIKMVINLLKKLNVPILGKNADECMYLLLFKVNSTTTKYSD